MLYLYYVFFCLSGNTRQLALMICYILLRFPGILPSQLAILVMVQTLIGTYVSKWMWIALKRDELLLLECLCAQQQTFIVTSVIVIYI